MAAWNDMADAPRDGTEILLVFADGEISTARHDADTASSTHNGWWSHGLDFGYGASDPIGWLPRDALPPTPAMKIDDDDGDE